MTKKKIILIILLIVLFIGASLTIYYLTKEDKKLNITGTVLISTEEYIIIESNNGDYIVNGIQNNYDVGDEITITYKESSMKDTTNPKEVTAIKEKLIKKDDDEEKEITNIDNETSNIIENTTKTEENTQNNTNNFNQSITDNNSNTANNNISSNEHKNETTTNDNYNNIAVKSADEEVLNYVNTLQSNADQGITDTLKEGFITVVDFLFYNGTIAGHTFNELTTSAKLEVLKAALFIDEKIDKYFPGYKETISNGMNKVYTTIKNLVVSTYLDITSNICENHNDLCASAKEGFQDLKKSFNFTWSFLKDLASSGLDKLKNWYEIWSGK